jgi:Tfp pilus assembly protein PilZ
LVEQRRHQRTPIDLAVAFGAKDAEATRTGRAKDVSVGGMFIETAEPLPFSSEVVVSLQPPGAARPVRLPGLVRWTNARGMGVQFGLLGARETHALTELARDRAS